MDEKIFYENDNVRVTNARFIVKDQTYALSSVNSVKTSVVDVTSSHTVPILTLVGGVSWLFFLTVLQETDPINYIQAAALVALGIYLLARIKTKVEYILVLTTSSGEAAALRSNKEQEIIIVERALNDAIVYRG